MLEAYGRLKWEIPDLRLLVVGPGNPDKDSYHVLSSRNLQDVEFVGRVPYDDLPRYYASADIFCSPATGGESFGIVLLEAMAAGKPVVASDIEGYQGVMQDGRQGLLFRNENVESLAAQLESLIRNPELRQAMGERGRATAEGFRWEVVAQQVEQYYQSCIEVAHGIAGQRTT